jgi:hypothetical protein
MVLPNDLRISCEGATRQPPRRPRLEPTAWRLPEPARPRQLHALVRRTANCGNTYGKWTSTGT